MYVAELRVFVAVSYFLDPPGFCRNCDLTNTIMHVVIANIPDRILNVIYDFIAAHLS